MKEIILRLLLLAALLPMLTPPVFAETFTCQACHSAMKGKIRTEKGIVVELNIDEENFSKSVHGNLGCTACHKAFKDNPHEPPKGDLSKEITDIVNRISLKAGVDPVAHAACIECHGDIYKTVTGSVHGKNIIEKRQTDGPLCIDCHGSPHYIMPGKSPESHVNRWNVVKACGECHEKEQLAKKYDFSTKIIEKYEESFHGKKYKLGHPDVPTCVDCHGAHDVRKWEDPASPMSWERRVETCGKCHPGTTKKFVTSVTHKPTGKDNPIPYYGEKLLIVLTMGVFVFIVSHVALDFYADVRDRFFRKKKEESHD